MVTAVQGRAKLIEVKTRKKSVRRGGGGLVFAGDYWPEEQTNRLIYHDVRRSVTEARKLAMRGYLAASAGCRGAPKFTPLMERWFGPRTGHDATDWWAGARHILGSIEQFVNSDIHLYYRGDRALIGQPVDYPGEVRNLIAYDFVGYAESDTNARNNQIGLCEDFFARRGPPGKRQAAIRLSGFDSVGGTIIHELSHNICGTLDHDLGGNDCYGLDDCNELAEDHPHLAWWNADNIEYFCEQVAYGG